MTTNIRQYDLVVVGGGASGFFGALSAAHHQPGLKVCILEKTTKVLAKVKVSGGGRCNVTHACFSISEFIKHYPRGAKELKNVFKQFSAEDTIKWFESRNVKLKSEADGRMFPITDSSQTIIDCLLKECNKHKIEILKECAVNIIEKLENNFKIELSDSELLFARKVIVASGGNAKETSYNLVTTLGHTIERPVPSLFTFNIPGSDLKDLQGVSVSNAVVRVVGTKLSQQGPLLITHWGFSGPAILKLSAWGAKALNDMNYKFKIHINWIGAINDEELNADLILKSELDKRKLISSNPYFGIPKRLWTYLVGKAEIEIDRKWMDISKKQYNKLMEAILRSEYEVIGKTTFKEEFVTCGGLKLSEVNMETMESKNIKGLFFGGEVLNIDGVTGGFNFQSAWSTGWVAGKNI